MWLEKVIANVARQKPTANTVVANFQRNPGAIAVWPVASDEPQ